MTSHFSVQLPVQFLIPVRKVDSSVKLPFITTVELSTDEYMELDKLRNTTGWLTFSQNAIQASDVPKEQALDTDTATPSKRLRNALFVLHKQRGIEQDFEAWYRGWMENIITKVKDELEG